MTAEEHTIEEKIGFFSKIKRGFAAVVSDAAPEEQPFSVPQGDVVTPDSQAPVSEALISEAPVAVEGAVSAHSLGLPIRSDSSEEASVLVITSEGISGPQSRRTRGHGPAMTSITSAPNRTDWLLPESIGQSDALLLTDEASDACAPDSDLSDSVLESRTLSMANNLKESLNELMEIDGAVAVALVDGTSGMAMGTAGGGPLNLEVAAAGNSEVVRAKLKVMKALELKENIEDILISLNTQYHLIRPMAKAPEVFIYLVLNRSNANLAMARHKLASIERELQI